MRKVVINRCFGGFDISEDAYDKYLDLLNLDEGVIISVYDIERDDIFLVQVAEEMGEKANGRYSELKIVEIPDDVEFEIQDYDGMEWVAEKHRTWR